MGSCRPAAFPNVIRVIQKLLGTKVLNLRQNARDCRN